MKQPLTNYCLFDLSHQFSKPFTEVPQMKYLRWLCSLVFLFYTASPAYSQCGGPNIALGKKVAVSHFLQYAEGAKAVDGYITNGSRWKTPDTARVNGELIEWISVDLDSTRNICTVRLIWESQGFPSSFKLQTSDDATNWKDIFSTINNNRSGTTIPVVGRGKYLRVYHVKPFYSWSLSYAMVELQAYEGTGTGNLPPIINITGAGDGASYRILPYLAATASDDRGISKVEFYIGNVKVLEDSTAPYGGTWTPPSIGTYQVFAKAYDNGTPVLVTTSQTTSFHILEIPGPNRPPVVSFISPHENEWFTSGGTIYLSATAGDDWGVSKVEFYQDTIKLGEILARPVPYIFEWRHVPAGSYSITARAYDNGTPSLATTSTPVNIVVKPAVPPGETDPVYSGEKSNLVNINGAYYNPSWIKNLHASKIIAPGTNTQVVFNNNGVLDAIQHFTYNPAKANFTFGGPAADYFTDYATFSSSFGHANYLRRQGSNAFGFHNDVSANISTAFGDYNHITSTAEASFAFGRLQMVRGAAATAFGRNNYTSAYGSFVIGHYSPDIPGSTNIIVPTDPLFVVANGTSETKRSAALIVYKSGFTTFSGRTKHQQGIEFADGTIQTTAAYMDTVTVWSLNGNRNLPDGSFIGTSDQKPLVFGTGGVQRLRIDSSGMVVIGSTTPVSRDFKLYVEKGIRTGRVHVQPNAWADYVFDSKYSLNSLSQVEAYIKRFKRLPDMPSAEEVKKNGVDLGDTQVLLLKKIEELTLYVIDLNKKVEALSKENEKLNKLVKKNKK